MRFWNSLLVLLLATAEVYSPAAVAAEYSAVEASRDPVHFLATPSENRLDQTSVYALHQDSVGYLWVGTQSGLHRYDGIRYSIYHHSANQPRSLPSDFIRSIEEDEAGRLWVGTSRGLAFFDRGSGDFVPVEPSGPVPKAFVGETVYAILSRGDHLWLGTTTGLFKLRLSDFFTERIALPGGIEKSKTRVYALASDEQAVWVGTRDLGLVRIGLNEPGTESVPLSPKQPGGGDSISCSVLALTMLPDGGLAVGTTAGLFRVSGINDTSESLWRSEVIDLRPVAALVSDESRLWVGTLEDGLIETDLATGLTTEYRYHPDPLLGLPGNRVRSLLIDSGGVLWVGLRQRGLRRAVIGDQRFAFFRVESENGGSHSGNDVRGIWGGFDESILISTINGGLKRLNPENGDIESLEFWLDGFPAYPPTTVPRVTAALKKSEGSFWVGSNLGLGVFDIASGGVRFVPLDSAASGRTDFVSTLLLGNTGHLWVGTTSSGLYRVDPDDEMVVHLNNRDGDLTTISSDRIHCLANDHEGNLLVGNAGGIDRVDSVNLVAERLIHPEDLARMESPRVTAILQKSLQSIWLGTPRGFVNLRIDPGGKNAISTLMVGSQYASNRIQSIFGDAEGCFWSSTFSGVVQHCPESGISRFFGEEDGLQPQGFNTAAYQAPNSGRIFFGGPDGINSFIPVPRVQVDQNPRVVITGIQVGDETLLPGSEKGFEVAHDEPLIRFEVSLLDFKAPSKNRFRYRLDPLHDRWHVNHNLQEISFTHLDPGSYTLEVTGANETDDWSSVVTTARFVVRPPPWKTWWAYLLYFAAGAIIAAAFASQNFKRRAERFSAEKALRQLAYFDTLTGLPNRTRLAEHCDALLRDPGESDVLAFYFIDLDRFKTINDTLGHRVGDRLLVHISERLRSSLPASCFIARWGGDEFVILHDMRTDTSTANDVSDLILDLFSTLFDVDGYEFSVTASIGVSLAPTHGVDWQTLLRKADAALSQAKKLGRNRKVAFDESIGKDVESRWQLENELRSTLRDGSLQLAYQPLVYSEDHRLASVEVLARWTHAELGSIPPGRFIPIAEETGMIYELEEWILRNAVRQGAAWRASGLLDCRISVNVSPLEFRKGDLCTRIATILEQAGLAPEGLELEITEGVVMADPVHAHRQIEELRTLGVSVAIDDFGTGHSSLSLLSSLGVDRLKIDRSFVARAATNDRERGILSGIIQIARTCEVEVIAEGVETSDQEDMLKSLGCPVLQGFLFSRPLDSSDFEARLRGPGFAIEADD